MKRLRMQAAINRRDHQYRDVRFHLRFSFERVDAGPQR